MPQMKIRQNLKLYLLLPFYMECKLVFDRIVNKEILNEDPTDEINRFKQLEAQYKGHLKPLLEQLSAGHCQSLSILHAAQAHPKINKLAKHEANLMSIEDLDTRSITLKRILIGLKNKLADPVVRDVFRKGLSDVVTHRALEDDHPLSGFTLFRKKRTAQLNPDNFPFEIVDDQNRVLKIQSSCIVSGKFSDGVDFDGSNWLIYDCNNERIRISESDESKQMTYCRTYPTKEALIIGIRKCFAGGDEGFALEMASLGHTAEEKYEFSFEAYQSMINQHSQDLLSGYGLYAICDRNPKKYMKY